MCALKSSRTLLSTRAQSSCVECDLPNQNGLVEASAMKWAAHFLTDPPIGRSESHLLCTCNHPRVFMSNLQSHYLCFSSNGLLAGDTELSGFDSGSWFLLSGRHFQTPPLFLAPNDSSNLSTICSYFLWKSEPNFVSTSLKFRVRPSNSDLGRTFSVIGKRRLSSLQI